MAVFSHNGSPLKSREKQFYIDIIIIRKKQKINRKIENHKSLHIVVNKEKLNRNIDRKRFLKYTEISLKETRVKSKTINLFKEVQL